MQDNSISEKFGAIMCLCAEGQATMRSIDVIESVLKEAQQGFAMSESLLRYQNFGVFHVEPVEAGWNVRLGPEDGDPWITVQVGKAEAAPEVGDIVTVLLPQVVSIKKQSGVQYDRKSG